MRGSGLLERFKWLALAACFMALVISAGAHTRAAEKASYLPALSAPASEDWNLPKQI